MGYAIAQKYRWPGGIIPYTIDEGALPPGSLERDTLNQAIELWNGCTRSRLIPYTNHLNYVIFTAKEPQDIGRSCNSEQIGINQSVGAQKIRCRGGIVRTYLHEIGHAAGLLHEHQRFDRNSYIDVHPENVDPAVFRRTDEDPQVSLRRGIAVNYDIRHTHNDSSVYTPLTDYDSISIMHYTATAGSRPGTESIHFHSTPEPNPHASIYFSPKDILSINALQRASQMGYTEDSILEETNVYDLPQVYIRQSKQLNTFTYNDIEKRWIYLNLITVRPDIPGYSDGKLANYTVFRYFDLPDYLDIIYVEQSNVPERFFSILQKTYHKTRQWINLTWAMGGEDGTCIGLTAFRTKHGTTDIFVTKSSLTNQLTLHHLQQKEIKGSFTTLAVYNSNEWGVFPRAVIRDFQTNILHIFAKSLSHREIIHWYENEDGSWSKELFTHFDFMTFHCAAFLDYLQKINVTIPRDAIDCVQRVQITSGTNNWTNWRNYTDRVGLSEKETDPTIQCSVPNTPGISNFFRPSIKAESTKKPQNLISSHTGFFNTSTQSTEVLKQRQDEIMQAKL